jgi:hypothetical protein
MGFLKKKLLVDFRRILLGFYFVKFFKKSDVY